MFKTGTSHPLEIVFVLIAKIKEKTDSDCEVKFNIRDGNPYVVLSIKLCKKEFQIGRIFSLEDLHREEFCNFVIEDLCELFNQGLEEEKEKMRKGEMESSKRWKEILEKRKIRIKKGKRGSFEEEPK